MLCCMRSCLHLQRVTSYFLHELVWLPDNRAERMDDTGDTTVNKILILIMCSHMVLRMCLLSRRKFIIMYPNKT